jgi:hypothetical protein
VKIGGVDFHLVSAEEYFPGFLYSAQNAPQSLKVRPLSDMVKIQEEGGKFFLGLDGKVGFIVKRNGEVFGAFNNSSRQGLSRAVLRAAPDFGGKFVVCVDNLADPRSSPCFLYRLVGMEDDEIKPFTRANRPDMQFTDEELASLRIVKLKFPAR